MVTSPYESRQNYKQIKAFHAKMDEYMKEQKKKKERKKSSSYKSYKKKEFSKTFNCSKRRKILFNFGW